jgi:hypothetical protein
LDRAATPAHNPRYPLALLWQRVESPMMSLRGKLVLLAALVLIIFLVWMVFVTGR